MLVNREKGALNVPWWSRLYLSMFCYLGLKELIHCTSLSMEYVLSFSCSGLRWRIFSSVDKLTQLFYNMHQHANQIHIYCHCKYTTASGKVQKIELSTEIHCHSMSLSEIQIKQFCALQGDFSLTICLMIFQNNSVDFQIFPHNEDVHCSHFESLISKKESQ